jgi:hypothetical protein
MTEFGDSEPEDGWDADDPPRELLGNIARRVLLLRGSLDAVATPRERLRFDQISEDLEHVMDRLRDG